VHVRPSCRNERRLCDEQKQPARGHDRVLRETATGATSTKVRVATAGRRVPLWLTNRTALVYETDQQTLMELTYTVRSSSFVAGRSAGGSNRWRSRLSQGGADQPIAEIVRNTSQDLP
jgi:hypothetical protein